MMKAILIFLILFSLMTSGQEAKRVIIPELKVQMNETLDTALQQLANQISTEDIPVTVEYEKEGLSDLRLPKFQVRQVSVNPILSTLGHVSGTKIILSEGKILVRDGQKNLLETLKKVQPKKSGFHVEQAVDEKAELEVASKTIDLEKSFLELAPLQGVEMTKEVYDLSDIFRKSGTGAYQMEQISSNLKRLLTQHAGFRRDALEDQPFLIEHHSATGVIVLKAPVSYHLTAQNFFAELRQNAGIVPPKKESLSQVSEEPAVADFDVDETLESLEKMALLKALREMNRKLERLEKRSQLQGEKIDELNRLLHEKNEEKKSE